MENVRTTCPYCGVGCGVLARPDGAGGAAIAGDPDHPANQGRLCAKGSTLGETLSLERRLRHPIVAGARAGYADATRLVAARFTEAVRDHGPDSVALYVSGQLLTEDYYVANKLAKGFLGTANIDTNSRLCMASSVAGHIRAFGADTVPGIYEDFEEADLVVLVGSNLAWCHPILHQRLEAARALKPAMRVIAIDPRMTATARAADAALSIAPGSDVALFRGLLRAIEKAGAIDRAYVAAHVAGFEDSAAAARDASPEAVAAETGVDAETLMRFYRAWIETERVVTIYSQGVNQAVDGVDRVSAILNCHLATGRIGKPGMGPFSVTGQPNAMGGREVGGLANQLACHLALDDPGHRAAVQAFWDAPRMATKPGLKALDLFDAVADGAIEALWIMATNPAVSLPDADRIARAIERCPFVVVSDVVADTETARRADVLLPAAAWGEKSGSVTNSERVISRQRAFVTPPGEARPDWRIICDVATAMGFETAFAYDSPAAIFREHAALSAVARSLGRDFDLSALETLTDEGYDDLAPTRWPVGGHSRFFARGAFFTPDRRARMTPLGPKAAAAQHTPGALLMNTGRTRDQWHSMTRTGRAPTLALRLAEPYCEINPEDAAARGVGDAEIVRVENARGQCLLRALLSDAVAPGQVFAPIHWSAPFSSKAKVGALIPPARDPISGQPATKSALVELRPARMRLYGFALSRETPQPRSAYWAMAPIADGWRLELADDASSIDHDGLAATLLGSERLVRLTDRSAGRRRYVRLEGERIKAALFLDHDPVEVARAYAIDAFARDDLGALMAAKPGAGLPEPGATLCSCRGVGEKTIMRAIEARGLADVRAVGEALGAGVTCGSCRPEIAALLARATRPVAAE